MMNKQLKGHLSRNSRVINPNFCSLWMLFSCFVKNDRRWLMTIFILTMMTYNIIIVYAETSPPSERNAKIRPPLNELTDSVNHERKSLRDKIKMIQNLNAQFNKSLINSSKRLNLSIVTTELAVIGVESEQKEISQTETVTDRINSNGDSATMGLLSNMSYLLDTLLSEDVYDKRIRPGFGGFPLIIYTDIEIRSFGPLSENDMIYSLDCYFRQTWVDTRLKFGVEPLDGKLLVLSMDWKFLQRVWIPDTTIFNGKNSYMHKVTVPNKFIRVRQDGQLRYSMRLTIKASCPMHLRKYPLDAQSCPLEIGSFAYKTRDIIYKWKGSVPVVISDDVTLSQYYFVNITAANLSSSEDERSSIMVRFILQRRRGYFILQIYAPCALIVGASWVSFWIHRSDSAGRVSVGATTVLTLVTMGFGGRVNLPRVTYATALDWFVIMCFTFVFTAMVEYACVNFVDYREAEKIRKVLDDKLKRHCAIPLQKSPIKENKTEENPNSTKVTHRYRNYDLRSEMETIPSNNGVDDERAEMIRARDSNDNNEIDMQQNDVEIDENDDEDDDNDDIPDYVPKLFRVEIAERDMDKDTSEVIQVIDVDDNQLCKLRKSMRGQHKYTSAAASNDGNKKSQKRRLRYSKMYKMTVEQLTTLEPIQGLMVDEWSRIVFPCTFALLNIIYWIMYLYTIDDELEIEFENMNMTHS